MCLYMLFSRTLWPGEYPVFELVGVFNKRTTKPSDSYTTYATLEVVVGETCATEISALDYN